MSLRRQIYETLKAAILSGALPNGTRLSATRTFAREHNVSRGTVVEAFDQLRADGLISSRQGAGTFVTSEGALTQKNPPTSPPEDLGISSRGMRIANLAEADLQSAQIGAFRRNMPAIDQFPMDHWLKLLRKASRVSPSHLLDTRTSAGLIDLRAAIVRHLILSRGIEVSPDQIIVTDGAQQALDILGQVFIESGDFAYVEDPGYAGARSAFVAAGAHIVSVPVDRSGFDVPYARAHGSKPKIVYVTPSAQTAYGCIMPLNRRQELLAWAQENDAWVISDECQSEFRYEKDEILPLERLRISGRVVTVGTFGTTMWPSIGIGFMIVPPSLAPVVAAARRLNSRSQRSLEQSALAEFLDSQAFSRHVARMRALYAERRDVTCKYARKMLGPQARVILPEAGLHAFVRLNCSVSDVRVQEGARARGIALTAASPFCAEHVVNGLLLGFGNVQPEAIPYALAVVRQCIDAAVSGTDSPLSFAAGT